MRKLKNEISNVECFRCGAVIGKKDLDDKKCQRCDLSLLACDVANFCKSIGRQGDKIMEGFNMFEK